MQTVEDPMFTMMASISILLSYIILSLVLVVLVLEKDSVFGHALGAAEAVR